MGGLNSVAVTLTKEGGARILAGGDVANTSGRERDCTRRDMGVKRPQSGIAGKVKLPEVTSAKLVTMGVSCTPVRETQ